MKKNRLYFASIFFIALLLVQADVMQAQIVGGGAAYIQGTSVEIGVSGIGGFEGVPTGTYPAPSGYHGRSSTGYFGFVANPQLNAWAGSAYDGDFFTPGSPENGWGFEIGTSGGPKASNNCSFTQQINGAITNWNHTFNCYTADWEGDYTSGTDLHFKISYFLQQTDLYYTTTVSITNNTAATIPDMYYYRNVDPDNNEEIGGSFTTQNTIVSEPSTGCQLAHVSATQSTPWNSYLGFAATGANWRCDYGGFSNRDASDLWYGTGAYTPALSQVVGSTLSSDDAISLAYRIQNLAPGATETFKFVVILDAAHATAAINNLLYLSYPGSASAPPAVCTPYTDTIRTCGGPVPISVGGPIVGDFTWSWSPTTGLTPTTGPTISANPAVTTTYTATGTPLSACVAPVSLTFVVQVTPGGGVNPVITPVAPVCISTPPFNLTVDSAGGTWSGAGITNATLGTFNPTTAGVGTHLITYTTSSLCNSSDTLNIVVTSADATITPHSPVCANAAPFNLSAVSAGGTWTGTGITSGTAGTFSPAVSGVGVFTITYTLTGLCATSDTVLITVNPMADPTITQPAPVCVASPAFNLTAVDPGGTWSGTGITNPSTGLFNPATAGAGTHIIMYTISSACGTVDTVNVTVLAVYNATITNVGPKCITAPAFNMQAASVGGTWTGTGITNAATGTFDPEVAGAGVHLITYTISGLCGTNDTALVTVIPSPVLSIAADTTQGCEPTTINFIGSTDQPGGTYLWNFGDGSTLADTANVVNPSYMYQTAGVYTVSFTYANTLGCSSDTISTNLITIHAVPHAAFASIPNTVDIITPTINFLDQSLSIGAINTWTWSFGTGDGSVVQNPSYTYPAEGSYPVQLIVSNVYGCLDTTTNYVTVDPVYLFYAPNAFTPDGDGNNDVFMIKGESFDKDAFEMSIFNRWGERIFRTTDANVGWNGAKNNTGAVVEQDVYVWKIVLRDFQGIRHQYIGHVTIVK